MVTNKIKEQIRVLPRWKKILWFLFIILPPILMTLLITWGFSNHGIYGLYVWVNTFRILLWIVGLFCILIPIFALMDLLIANRRINIKRIPSRAIWGMGLVALFAPTFLFGLVGVIPQFRYGDKSPQLLIADGTGTFGVPNLAVGFWTQSSTKNTLNWGTDSQDLAYTMTEEVSSHEHAFMLRNLQPATRYFYQINEGKIYNFTTTPATNNTLKFALSSDSHFGRDKSNNTATIKIMENILDPAHANNMFFLLGDQIELGYMDSQWEKAINTLSPFTSSIMYRPILGNHDTLFGGFETYQSYFYPNGMDTNQTSDSRVYYHMKVNNIHLFFLDLEWGNDTNSPEQMEWFKREIATVKSEEWCIVMSHAFFYTSGIYDAGAGWWDNQLMIDTFEPFFIQHDVDLVFSGHNHHLEVLEVNGTIYGIEGGLGGKPDPTRDRNGTGSIWYEQGQHGFAEVNISGTTANLTYYTPEYAQLFTMNINE